MSAVASRSPGITPEQATEERSLLVALVADTFLLASMVVIGVMGGSLTIIAESLRGALMMSTEVFAFVLMRRLHRGRLANLEFGTGKLEQVGSFLIGGGMLVGAAWIVSGALEILEGQRHESTPIWLAAGAIVGAVNLVINIVTWDSMRRAVRAESSLVMVAQYKARSVKLLASAFVQVTLTVAALANDGVVVATADAIGSTFVAAFIAVNAVGILRECVPDLLDRSAGQDVRAAVHRALTRHDSEFLDMERIRSRRSGRAVFVEVTLRFEETLSLAEVNRRIETIRATLLGEIEHGDISILTAARSKPA